jgi:hypothetical protein
MSYISAYCRMRNYSVSVNGEVVSSAQEISKEDWMKQLYKNLQVDYPKFYKMDVLSKLSFLGTEILKKNQAAINHYADDEIALLFSNCNSSADVDMKFQRSYQEEAAPSPALFVYTLPNILTGEIAIRNSWYGENLFFLCEKFDATFFVNHCNILLNKTAKACLCGWIESVNEETDVFLFFVEKNPGKKNIPLTHQTLANLYKS